MKSMLSAVFLLLGLLGALPLHAEDEDLLKDVMVYKHPEDFATAQQLALQSRQERLDRLQEVIGCIQQAATMEDISACQENETLALAKVRLAYCDTNVSWSVRKGKTTEESKDKATDESEGEDARPASECTQVISGLLKYQKRHQDSKKSKPAPQE